MLLRIPGKTLRREHFRLGVANKPADAVGRGSGVAYVASARVGRVLEPNGQVLLQAQVREQQQSEYNIHLPVPSTIVSARTGDVPSS